MTVKSQRPSPAGKRVSLFVTCMVDMLYPQTGMAVVRVLDHLGIPVDFPKGQTCCGQPGLNAGYQEEARTVARGFLRAFREAEAIVTPSGSCAAMIRHEYPSLFKGELAQEAQRVASITWEFSEYLVDGLAVTDLGGCLPAPHRFAFHDSCHAQRLSGVRRQPRLLLQNTGNASLVELEESDTCCGFGGLFSLKMADVSGAMLRQKLQRIESCPADTILSSDVSCLAHINGGLLRSGSKRRLRHVADVLAESLNGGR